MPTPSELVTDAFAKARDYARTAQEELAAFTGALNTAIQHAPLTDITFNPVADPGVFTVAPYQPPEEYTSAMATLLADTLIARLAGGTGLTPAVETALWDRARERELATMQANIDQVSRDSEALGFPLPPGVLVDSIRRETRGYYDKVSTHSRDIAIEQAKLEQANTHKTIEQAMGYEKLLSDIGLSLSKQALDVFAANIERFKAEVDQEVKHWEAEIKQYEAQITVALSTQRINSDIIRANASAVLDAAKVGAQVYSQLTASAYAMIKASAGVSAGASNSVSYSYGNDTTAAVPPVTAV